MKTKPKYTDIRVKLTGTDGNGFAIVGKVMSSLRRAGVPDSEVTKFQNDATSADYAHLLRTCMRWVSVG